MYKIKPPIWIDTRGEEGASFSEYIGTCEGTLGYSKHDNEKYLIEHYVDHKINPYDYITYKTREEVKKKIEEIYYKRIERYLEEIK